VGRRIGRDHAGDRAAFRGGCRFEGRAAVAAHVIEAAVGRAAIEDLGGAALRTRDFELAGLHFAIFEEGRTSGARTTFALLTRSSICFFTSSGRTFASNSALSSVNDLVCRVSTRIRW